MQKNNFSDEQKLEIFNALSSKLFVRVNRAGNIDVVNPKRTNQWEHFVLYFTPNKRYLWRRWINRYNVYPLNMKGRKYGWDTKNCEFNTVTDALNYFNDYMKKYHNINI